MNKLTKDSNFKYLIGFIVFSIFILGITIKDIKQDAEANYIQQNFECYKLSNDGDMQITLRDGSGYYFNIYEDVKTFKITKDNELYLNNHLTIKLSDNDINKLSSNKMEFTIVDTYITKSGNTVIEFNDNSYTVVNHSKNTYEFTAAELGDWETKVNNNDDLKKVVATYMINKYNMNDEEIKEVLKYI